MRLTLTLTKRKTIAVAVFGALLAGSLIGYWMGYRGATGGASPAVRKVLYYIDPMHPSYNSDKPGIAPDCGMELVPVYEDGGMGGAGNAAGLPPGTVNVGPEKQQLIGVRIEEVSRASALNPLRALGRVAVDDGRLYRIIAATDGWIRELGENTAGTIVKENQILASYYTRDFLTAQQSLLFALTTNDQSERKDATIGSQRGPASLSLQVAIDSLRSLGMSDLQIEEIRRSRGSASQIHIYSPITGLVLARNVSPAQRFDRGAEFYRIADLSRVWILADIYEDEISHLRPGSMVKVSVPKLQRFFPAKVSRVLPQFDGTTRTTKVRLEADNPGLVLRPDMFVDVELPVSRAPGVIVPADAVVDSGLKQTVYVEKGNGVFEPRRVETGWRTGDQVEIVRGLMPGERIVVAGTFLIDSESRMKAAAGITGETSQDPVCGMEVDQGKAKAAGRTASYKGQTYYFCSDDCEVRFGKEPVRYALKAGRGQGAAGSVRETTQSAQRIGQSVEGGGEAGSEQASSEGEKTEPSHAGHHHP